MSSEVSHTHHVLNSMAVCIVVLECRPAEQAAVIHCSVAGNVENNREWRSIVQCFAAVDWVTGKPSSLNSNFQKFSFGYWLQPNIEWLKEWAIETKTVR